MDMKVEHRRKVLTEICINLIKKMRTMGVKDKLDQLRNLVHYFTSLLVQKPISVVKLIMSKVFTTLRNKYPYIVALLVGNAAITSLYDISLLQEEAIQAPLLPN